ncbi:Hypothetical protein HDN1F_26510 [gamma proteobacterium HdN1]|nr:Hypothetical protein HDN1F_26510 [gamma proteobacterium HdN1]
MSITTSRRGFMQLSATSMAILSMGAGFASLTGCSKLPAASGYQVLRAGDIEFLSALAPVVLAQSYPGTLSPEVAQERLMHMLDKLITTLQGYAQGQLMMLFDVVQSAPLRVAMDAQWASWAQASAADVERFLTSWKASAIPIKRMGYGSLSKLLCMCWYQQPETFASSGYPGMPKKVNITHPA